MGKMTNIPGMVSYRHRLLVTVSALALTGLVQSTAAMAADDTDNPAFWLELGGQLNGVGGQADPYVPHFTEIGAQHGLIPVSSLQAPPRYGIGGEAMISFQPDGSDWIFSAAARFGRSSANKHRHQEIAILPVYISSQTSLQPHGPNGPFYHTADYSVRSDESHAILDFQAGKDVGLGMHDAASRLAAGIRIAQFSSKANLALLGNPNPHLASTYFPPFHQSLPLLNYYQFYKVHGSTTHNFHGAGPSISWTAAMPLAGSSAGNAQLMFDWGINASVLFGRQKTRIRHQTTADRYENDLFGLVYHKHYVTPGTISRSRSVTVPNLGAMAGFSLKFPNAKVSIGYRADFFFGAMDGGVATRREMTRGFFGPFASINIGVSPSGF